MLPKLLASSAFWLPCTLGLYWAASELHRRAGKWPLLNPTMLTICGVVCLLIAFRVPYDSYFESVGILHQLLGTAVVALAFPLYRNLRKLASAWQAIATSLIVTSATTIICGLLIAKALGASPSTLLSIAPKSATAAVSMEIARSIGGLPAVTAGLTVITGIIGAVLGPYVLTWSGITSPYARGVALGAASHGIATVRAFSEGELAGSCASVAMGLNAVLTALLVPLIVVAMQIASWP